MADLSADARKKAAADGTALADGSFPIRNRKELASAIKLAGHSKHPIGVVRSHIRKRARALGATDLLPDSMH